MGTRSIWAHHPTLFCRWSPPLIGIFRGPFVVVQRQWSWSSRCTLNHHFSSLSLLLRSGRPTLEAPLAALFVLAYATLWWWSRCNYPTHYLPTMRTVGAKFLSRLNGCRHHFFPSPFTSRATSLAATKSLTCLSCLCVSRKMNERCYF